MAGRLSMEKTPLESTSFDRLPDEIIEQILASTDPNGFASLILLNQKWRAASRRPHLYVQHLSKCPTFASASALATLPLADDSNFPRLQRLFAQQVKRNLFHAYLRPNETVIKIISNSNSSSSCPGGEGMHFSPSPKAHHFLAYNSSRIYVIDVQGSQGIEIKRELKILRRPAAACILDDASLLAVLSTEMQVDVYDLESKPPKRKKSIILDNSPRAIALSPCGSVLAAAYDGGIEVSSLNQAALATDRRSVKCDGVDTLAFSFDGTQLLATTTHSAPPSTVILTAPYYEPGSHAPEDSISAMWTTSILFPNSSRDCSHAVLLQDGHQEEATWTFTWDRSFEAFRAVRIDDLRNGTTYFTGPEPDKSSHAELLPSTAPGTTYHGDLVSAGFHEKEVWVYGVPEDLDAVPEMPSHLEVHPSGSGLGRQNSDRSSASRHRSSKGHESNDERVPQWQLLCDQLRNTFMAGFKVAELSGVSHARWVAGFGESSAAERLVITAKGISGPRLVTDEEDINFVDGGRITLLDFDYRTEDGFREEITIEVGTNEAEVLEEERRDLDTEVAIVRRRTNAQRQGRRTSLLRPTASLNMLVPALPRNGSTVDDPLHPRRVGQNPANAPELSSGAQEEYASMEEQEALDAPYAHASPRSHGTLRRAATAAAVDRTLNPRTADGRPVVFRRADGRREHPHESDADNWVPPPPPYQKDDPGELPDFMRGQAASLASGVPPVPSVSRMEDFDFAMSRPRPLTYVDPPTRSAAHPTWHTPPPMPLLPRQFRQRNASDPNILMRATEDTEWQRPRPQAPPQEDNLYDVSPPESPRVVMQRRMRAGSSGAGGRRMPSGAGRSAMPTMQSEFSLSRDNLLIIPSLEPAQASGPSSVVGQTSPPNLALHIPEPQLHHPPTAHNYGTQPPMRRLSNAQTWPAGLEDGPPVGQLPGHRPAEAGPIMGFSPPLIPHGRRNMGHGHMEHRPRSELCHSPRPPPGGHNGYPVFHTPRPHFAPNTISRSSTWNTVPDQPLLISTGKGVSGAHDGYRRPDMPLLAPVPRRRPDQGPAPRPTVQQLETHYNGIPSQPPYPEISSPRPRSRGRLLAAFRREPSVSPRPIAVGVARHPSRAERGAAKNIKDAKKKGWKPIEKKKKRKQRKRKDVDNVSTAGWTDITTGSAGKEKDKKCVVM